MKIVEFANSVDSDEAVYTMNLHPVALVFEFSMWMNLVLEVCGRNVFVCSFGA